ncbi:Neurotransmitter-gated ion-channel ligand-binding domain [Trinorchestia longiramus]|nr:Neurotransmitter-gated ion-channel ligand-binding domain [Trinorchestia longiramus]
MSPYGLMSPCGLLSPDGLMSPCGLLSPDGLMSPCGLLSPYGLMSPAMKTGTTASLLALLFLLQHAGTLGYSLQHAGTLSYSLQHAGTLSYSLQHSGTLGYSLQHAGTLSYSLQHAGTLGYSLQHAGCEPVTVLEFLPDSIDLNSLLDAGVGALPDLWQLSYCTRFYLTRYCEGLIAFFSYHQNTEDSLLEFQGASGGFFRVQVESAGINTAAFDLEVVERLRWQSVCFSVNISRDSAQVSFVFNDQTFSVNVTVTGRPLVGGGRLVIGQELDEIAGGFNNRQSFHGRQADMWMISRALSIQEMMEFTQNCSSFQEDDDAVLYNFENKFSKFEVIGSVRNFSVEREEICNEQKELVLPFLSSLKFSLAVKVCKTMGATLFYPKNRVSEEAFFRDNQLHSKLCLGSYSTSFWYGIAADYQLQEWKSLADNATIEYSNFRKGYDTIGPDMCVSVATLQDAWFSMNCNQTACAVCAYKSLFEIRILGLCAKSTFERTLSPDSLVNGEWSFSSVFYSRLVYDGSNWTLRNILDGSVIRMTGSSTDIPLGRSVWFSPSACKAKMLNLTITACLEDLEWTCWDGKCIKKSLRCDKSEDCADGSDEIDCFQFELPLGYSPHHFPPSSEDETFTPVIFTRLITVKNLDLTTFSLSIDFIAFIWWRDTRIKMHFLTATPEEVSPDPRLWQPDFVLEDEFGSMVHVIEYRKVLTVEEKGHPQKNSPTHHSEDDYYEGADISLLLATKLGTRFSCSFDLNFYPFDVQTCAVILRMINVPKISMKKDDKAVLFDGRRHLLEYSLVKLNLSVDNHQAGMPHLKLILEFKNQYTYYIGNAFVPSLLVVLVCYYVFYFALDDFQQARIFVTSTTASSNISDLYYIKLEYL